MKSFIKELYYICLAIIMVATTIACNTITSHQYTLQNMPKTQLIFGSGGGFTGMTTEYCLLENGQLYETNTFTQEMVEMRPARKSKTDKMFTCVTKMDIEKIQCDMPGNMYYYIVYKTEHIHHRITWGDPTAKIDDGLKKCYHELMKLADDCKEKPKEIVKNNEKNTDKPVKIKKEATHDPNNELRDANDE
jgi:hypothetical protein